MRTTRLLAYAGAVLVTTVFIGGCSSPLSSGSEPEILRVNDSGPDAVLEDGSTYYKGMVLERSSGVQNDEELELRNSQGDLITQLSADEEGTVLLRSGGQSIPTGSLSLHGGQTHTIAAFDLYRQQLSAGFDSATLDPSEDPAAAELECTSNRSSYSLRLNAVRDGGDALDPGLLESILRESSVQLDTDNDGQAETLRVSGRASVDYHIDFSGLPAGTYEVSLIVPDTGTQADAQIELKK